MMRTLTVVAAAMSFGSAAQTVPFTHESFAVQQEVPPPVDLPAREVARKSIDQDATVAQARFGVEAARQQSEMYRVGDHEWTGKTTLQRRRYENGTGTSNEWSVGLERAIRVGGKAEIDRQLGESVVRLAEAHFGEARHETARVLLDHWMTWLAAERSRQIWSEQLDFARANVDAALKRRKAGDASQLEVNAARADHAEVQRQLIASETDAAKSQARMRVRFPQVPMRWPALADPAPLEFEDARWREMILDESDELRIAREEMRRAELTAARVRADRIADPTVGIFTTSEAFRNERIVGINLSIPFGGRYRTAATAESLQHAEAARAAMTATTVEIESAIAENLADAAGSLQRWNASAANAVIVRDSATLSQRAYALGELDLQSLILSRRQRLSAALDAEQARVAALKARYRLLLDAHLIWGLKEE